MNRFNYIETFPGIVVAVIDKRNAEILLSESDSAKNKYSAGLVKFSELTESDCRAIVSKHEKFGYFEYPIITKNSLYFWNERNGISSYQKWKDNARLSLISACLTLNNLFNPNIDYIYLKIETKFAFV